MTSPRAEFTPHMEHYTFVLEDQPYLGYFQYGGEKTPVYTTDRHGFRATPGPGGQRATVGDDRPAGPVRVLAGSSAVFGVGATSDAATISARLWNAYAPRRPWLNFAGQSHNSVQELLLFTLFQHELAAVEEIVLLSGVNNLVLSRLPEEKQGRHGAFFDCGPAPDGIPSTARRVEHATDLTLRHLGGWKRLADGLGAQLTFALQPLAPWVREQPLPREQALFDELDEVSNFRRFHHDISAMEVGRAYAERLATGCGELGVPFVDMNVALGEAAGPEDWLFIDRVHCTDLGYDLAARRLTEHLELT
ncbi:Inducer of phenazine A [Streptomyces sp. BBFR102]|uniref:Inducer of phenazine A n=1 Tax=Streptomyces sp. BBFR102 TaxID=3448171 RepID=UPI003F536881